jgi:polyphosphate kinase
MTRMTNTQPSGDESAKSRTLPRPSASGEGAHLYFNRELSQIEFYRRVLEEAIDTEQPPLERLKFLAIFAENLDEFFMIRVSGLQETVAEHIKDVSPDERSAEEQFKEIRRDCCRSWPSTRAVCAKTFCRSSPRRV